MKRKVEIRKASGEYDFFDASKLKKSLQRSGAKNEVIKQIIDEIERIIYQGITTKEIYKKAYALLRKSSSPTAARYKLKRAIYELGPSGFPFEKFISEILKHEGFHTNTDVIIEGHCVHHEVDVVAEKEEKRYMIECKFHSDQGRYCDVKVPLYIQSRFKDIEKQWLKRDDDNIKFHEGWIYTNTRFTSDAIRYGKCIGLRLVGWDYPDKSSLKERIDFYGLHPITSLTTITAYEKEQLLDRGEVLCKNLYNNPDVLDALGITKVRRDKILHEMSELCKISE